MKRALAVLMVALAFAAMPAFSEGLGLDLGVEAKTNDVLNEDEDFGLILKPFVDYALGETGFLFEFNWAVPVLPDTSDGQLEAWEEYDFSAAGFDFAVGNDNIYYLEIDGDQLEGSIYAIATYALPMVAGLSISGEVDTYYLQADPVEDDLMIDAILTPTYETEIGPGTLTAKLRNYFHLYQKDTDADLIYTELRLSYKMPTGPVMTKFEVRPRIAAITDDPTFELYALVTVTYSM